MPVQQEFVPRVDSLAAMPALPRRPLGPLTALLHCDRLVRHQQEDGLRIVAVGRAQVTTFNQYSLTLLVITFEMLLLLLLLPLPQCSASGVGMVNYANVAGGVGLVVTKKASAMGSSVRADQWRADLPEDGCHDPIHGRRVHIIVEAVLPHNATFAATAATLAPEPLTSVLVNGQECLNLTKQRFANVTCFDWCRAHSNPATGDVWVSFHTSNTDWLGSAVQLQLDTRERLAGGQDGRGGVAVAAFSGQTSLTSADAGITLTHVATRNGGREAVLHLHNMDAAAAHTIHGCWFDGRPVAVPQPTVVAGGHVILLAAVAGLPKVVGDVWTVRVAAGGSNPSMVVTAGYGGRTAPERFPVESWARSSDCAIPGADVAHVSALRAFGVDSVFMNAGSFRSECGGGDMALLVQDWASAGGLDFHLFADIATAAALSPAAQLTIVDAVFCGDEVDGQREAGSLMSALATALAALEAAPRALTYQGAKTTRNIGAYAGMTDVQGCDAYCAACAPTMLDVDHRLPLQYPYYYLRNARDNTIPAPFWGYSQLYVGTPPDGSEVPRLVLPRVAIASL